jgi:hypothetical protein
LVALNMSDDPASLPGLDGRIDIGTERARDGTAFAGSLDLGPWEGLVARLTTGH